MPQASSRRAGVPAWQRPRRQVRDSGNRSRPPLTAGIGTAMPNSLRAGDDDESGPARMPVCVTSAKTRTDGCLPGRTRLVGHDKGTPQPYPRPTKRRHERLSTVVANRSSLRREPSRPVASDSIRSLPGTNASRPILSFVPLRDRPGAPIDSGTRVAGSFRCSLDNTFQRSALECRLRRSASSSGTKSKAVRKLPRQMPESVRRTPAGQPKRQLVGSAFRWPESCSPKKVDENGPDRVRLEPKTPS